MCGYAARSETYVLVSLAFRMYAASKILGFRQQNGFLFISAVNLVSDGNEEKSYYYYYFSICFQDCRGDGSVASLLSYLLAFNMQRRWVFLISVE